MRRCAFILILWWSAAAAAQDKLYERDDETPPLARSMVQDGRGILYFAMESGVEEFDGLSWRVIELGTQKAPANVLETAPDGRLYTAGLGEIGRLAPSDRGQMEFESFTQLLPEKWRATPLNFHGIAATSNAVFFMTEDGVAIYRDGEQKPTIDVLEGSYHLLAAIGIKDEAFFLDAEQGLLKFQENTLKPLPGGDFFRSFALSKDESGHLVSATADGIYVIDVQAEPLDYNVINYTDSAWFRGRTINRITPFARGFLLSMDKSAVVEVSPEGKVQPWPEETREKLGFDVSSHLLDKDGVLWVSSEKGIGSIPVLEPTQQKSATGILLRSLVSTKDMDTFFGGVYFNILHGAPAAAPSKLNYVILPFESNAVRFEYALNNASAAEDVEYQTFVEGLDTDWSDFSDRNVREVTNLLWDKYTFQVRAKWKDGTLTPVSTFSFRVDPPWHEQAWFYTLQIGILFVSMIVVVGIRLSQRGLKFEDPINTAIVTTAVGYAFTKVGAAGIVDAMAGGAAFMAILLGTIIGILMKPIETQVDHFVHWLEKRMEKLSIVKRIDRRPKAAAGEDNVITLASSNDSDDDHGDKVA